MRTKNGHQSHWWHTNCQLSQASVWLQGAILLRGFLFQESPKSGCFLRPNTPRGLPHQSSVQDLQLHAISKIRPFSFVAAANKLVAAFVLSTRPGNCSSLPAGLPDDKLNNLQAILNGQGMDRLLLFLYSGPSTGWSVLGPHVIICCGQDFV